VDPVENQHRSGSCPLQAGSQKFSLREGATRATRPPDTSVYGVDGTLRAVGFDLERPKVTSDPVPVLDGVVTKLSGAVNFRLSQNGSLAVHNGHYRQR